MDMESDVKMVKKNKVGYRYKWCRKLSILTCDWIEWNGGQGRLLVVLREVSVALDAVGMNS
jgi:hypothetical protein